MYSVEVDVDLYIVIYFIFQLSTIFHLLASSFYLFTVFYSFHIKF